MRILPLIVLFTCLVCHVAGRPQDDVEPRPVPNRSALLKRGPGGKQKTTTTTPAPQEEVEYEDEGDYPAEEEAQEPSTEATPSSTEGKKFFGGIRPFRSNTDLLEALKRRRAQTAGAKTQGGSSSVTQEQADIQTEAPVKANFSKKRFNTATRETKVDEAPAPAKPSRGRFGRPSSRSFQDAEPEEQIDTTPSARTGRTFSRRGGN